MFAVYLKIEVRGLQAQKIAQAQLLCCSDTDRHHQLTNRLRLPLQQDREQLIKRVSQKWMKSPFNAFATAAAR